MRFRTQLILGLAVEIALIAIVCALAVVSLTGVTREARRETQQALAHVLDVHQLRVRADQLVSQARGYLITGNPDYAERLAATQRALEVMVQEVDRMHLPSHVEVGRELAAYSQAVDEAVRRREHVTSLAALERLYEQELAARRAALDAAIARMEQRDRERAESAAEHEERVTTTAGLIVLAASVAAIALCIVLGVFVARRLARAFAHAEEAQQAAATAATARRELLDMVSHDLRSPLNTITLGLDALREEHGELAHLRPVENATQRMQRLVDDLLDAARAQSSGLPLELAPTDSYELLQLTVESFADRAERAGVELRIEHPLHAQLVADRERVLQILANLVGNALKVTPRGGSIVLAATPTNGSIRFTVHDSGPGIAPEQIPMLFDAYRQAGSGSGRRGSLGLGLYISKTLAQAHGGTIGVDSKLAEGSTFWFELPREPSTAH